MATTYSIQQRKKAQGIMTWYLRTCTDGRQKFESLHTTKKGEALAVLNQLRAKALMPSLPNSGDRPIAEMVTDWLRQVEVTVGAGSATFMAYSSRIANWGRWCARNGVLTHSSFTARLAVAYVQELSAGHAPKTVAEIVKVVKKCREWNTDTFGLAESDPFRTARLPKRKKGRVEFWTSDEVERILACAPSPEFRAFWGLMAYAGLRFSEARNLRKEDVHDGIIEVVNGKGGKTAEIPMSGKLEALVRPFLGGEGLLVPEGAVPMRSPKAVVYLKIAVGIAGIQGGETSHHKLRHSFASELLRKNVNPKTVQELMRHSSIDTLFDHYAHVLRSDLDDAVNRL